MTAAYPYREIIELASTGISRAKVGYLCGCGEVKVKDVLERAAAVGLAWPVPPELTDAEIERLVGPLEDVRRFAPDFEWLEAKMLNLHTIYTFQAPLPQARSPTSHRHSQQSCAIGWYRAIRSRPCL